MIVVRNTFIAKPGCASKLAAQLKDAGTVPGAPGNFRILTDVVGDSNRVVLEYELESLSAFEKSQQDYATNEEFRAKMKGYTDLYFTAHRDLLQTV
jgi:hypothetical protein